MFGAFWKHRVFDALPPSTTNIPGSNFGSPGRRKTMKIAIFCRRGHQNHEKRGHKNHEKPPPGEAYFVSGPLFATTLPAHSVKKRAGDRDFLVWTSAVTHTSHLKTSFLKQCAGRVWKFRVWGRNGIFWHRTKKTLFFHFCFLNKPLEGTEYTKKAQKKKAFRLGRCERITKKG